MKSIFDIFSGNVYTETDSLRISQTGEVFVRSGDNYISPKGELIIKQGSQLMNTRTGVMSSFGDPFWEDNE